MIESIVVLPDTDMDSLGPLRGGHVHQFVCLTASDIAAPVELSVVDDFPELPEVYLVSGGIFLHDDSMIVNSQVALVMFTLHDPQSSGVGLDLPVLMPLVSDALLEGHVGPISGQYHVREPKYNLISIFLLVLDDPHLVGVVLVDGTELQ